MADKLAQVYKKRLIDAGEDIFKRAREAFQAFKDVEKKAENEALSETMDTADAASRSDTFNNRGLSGCIQVAKFAFEKLNGRSADIYPKLEREVEAKFAFFEWYQTYSKPDMCTLEPHYLWRDVALCYEHYTNKRVAAFQDTSFQGLLDLLNHGLFMSKGRRAEFEEPEKTVPDLEKIQELLKTAYDKNKKDIKLAESYILSNILLSNKMPDSPKLSILQLLKEEDDEEVGQKATEDSKSADSTWEYKNTVEEQDREPGEPAQLSADLNPHRFVTFMEKAFERAGYAKYLRGRYLLPLFFLGKGSGLSKWIHKSICGGEGGL
ncbi:unnamed protein product [Oreochromis niloticus]|nr:unnamed protein product [Mustela putorius furo]